MNVWKKGGDVVRRHESVGHTLVLVSSRRRYNVVFLPWWCPLRSAARVGSGVEGKGTVSRLRVRRRERGSGMQPSLSPAK